MAVRWLPGIGTGCRFIASIARLTASIWASVALGCMTISMEMESLFLFPQSAEGSCCLTRETD